MSQKDLLNHEGHWTTEMGKAFPTERVVFRGKDLHEDLGHMSWFELNLHGITGRTFTSEQLRVLNFMWVCTSYPEPRVWNNRIASICGSVRANGPNAIGAAISASEATVYGGRPFVKGFDFFQRGMMAIANGLTLEDFVDQELIDNRIIFCFGRAMVKTDERVPHMMALLEEVGMLEGECVQFALKAEAYLFEKKGIQMNISALYASIAFDLGFSLEEFHMFMSMVFSAGMMPCYMEASKKPEGAFFPMRCEHVNYIGKKNRRTVKATRTSQELEACNDDNFAESMKAKLTSFNS